MDKKPKPITEKTILKLLFLLSLVLPQVMIEPEGPEVLNNLDILDIGSSPTNYLNPVCDGNIQPLLESPITSTACNQTLLELINVC